MTEKHIDEDNGDSSLSGADLKRRSSWSYMDSSIFLFGVLLSSVYFYSFEMVPSMSNIGWSAAGIVILVLTERFFT